MENSRIDDLIAVTTLVRSGQATNRGEISRQLGLRSTTVSDLVGQLISCGVLHENTARGRGKGRPAAVLSLNQLRLGAVFVTVTDQTLVASAVDLDLRVLGQQTAAPPQDTSTEAMTEVLRRLVADTAALFAPQVELCAVVCSLSGLLDVGRLTWCVSARWPEMRDLDLGDALDEFDCPVWLVRNLDAELAGRRISENHGPGETALLLHWGHGIGAAYAAGGDVVNRDRGRFCEIGHWRLGNGRDVRCTCGNTDCLETVAALWSIRPALLTEFPELPYSEGAIAAHLARMDLRDSAVVEDALVEVLRLTANLCRLLFPDRVILTGPFVQNPEVFSRFVQSLEKAPMLRSHDKVRVSVSDCSHAPELAGALREPFAVALRTLLEQGDTVPTRPARRAQAPVK
ncbi:ROK family protein [Palleronia pelagia]|uniref:Transcriptional regulator of PTS protein n=1 Tax=Palleronia pelagia TaxID=387096 RepID=A0A1H8ALP7_9RHOB|nr:ROK family protein [Palleronia pelagia]SEM70914.1 transcriptional regulator of PTS gene [Palleronia pelagia]